MGCDHETFRARTGCFLNVFVAVMSVGARRAAAQVRGVHVLGGLRTCLHLAVFFSLLLVLSNDIESNPGPRTHKDTEGELCDSETLNEIRDLRRETKKKFEKLFGQVTMLEQDLVTLTEENEELKTTVTRLTNKIDHLDNTSRQNNIILYNIEETFGESNEDVTNKALDVIQNKMGIKDITEFGRVARLPSATRGARPVLVTCLNFRHRTRILQSANLLKGHGISISQDFTEKEQSTRQKLTGFMNQARNEESEPLIEEEAEEWKENQDWEQDADDSENIDTNKMPFGFLKKSKKDKKDKKDKKKENEAVVDDAKPEDQQPIVEAPDADQTPAPRVFKEGTTLAAMASTVPKKPPPVKDDSEEYPDGGFDPSSYAAPSNDTKTSQPFTQEKENPVKLTDSEETELKKLEVKDAPVKSENSPLINKNGDVKESKLQDQQPGMLCCTIL